MRKSILKIKAELANCTEVQPLDDEEYPHDYEFVIRCARCGMLQPKAVMVNRFEPSEVKFERLKRTVHFSKKCPDCNNLLLLILVRTPNSLTVNDVDTFVPILDIYSHGATLLEYHLEDQYMCKTLSGEIVTGVDLRRNEWSELDEVTNQPMTILNFAYELEKISGNAAITSL